MFLTLIVTVFWLSDAVEKIWAFLVGITEFLVINLVITPPTVSIPKVRGLTSSNTSSPEINYKINYFKKPKLKFRTVLYTLNKLPHA